MKFMNKQSGVRIFFYAAILFSSAIGFCEIWAQITHKRRSDLVKPAIGEQFDPSLSKLTSIPAFTAYCDSLYGYNQINPTDSEKYAAIVSQTLRQKFYHGYSYYSLGQNSLAYLFAPLIKKDLSAIVIPDDILKHPMAACSQQSIVGMEVFKRKGISVRKIGFFADGYGGHFCFEAFFEGKWHFFDPDLEPSLPNMVANHFPSILEIVQKDTLLHKLYFKQDSDLVEKLFLTYSYGSVNKFPAPRARIYQYATKYLSYFSWLLLIVLYLIVQKRLNHSKKKEVCAELQDSLVPEIRA